MARMKTSCIVWMLLILQTTPGGSTTTALTTDMSDSIAATAVTSDSIVATAATSDSRAATAVTSGTIAATTVTSTIAATTVTSDSTAATAITSDSIAATGVTSDRIAANVVTSDSIAATAVTSDSIVVTAVTSDSLAATAVTSDSIAVTAVTSDNIAATAVTSDSIAVTAVISDSIAATAFTSDSIAATAVTSNSITATAVTSDSIAATAVTSDSIAATAVTSGSIAATAVTSDSKAATADTSDSLAATATTSDSKEATSTTSSSSADISSTSSDISPTSTPTLPEQSTSTDQGSVSSASDTGISATSAWQSSTVTTPEVTEQSSTSQATTPSTMPTPAPTTKLPESTVTSKPNLDGSIFKLSFKIVVDLIFDVELEDEASATYMKFEKGFIEKLREVYLVIPGFVNVTIKGFTNGSVGCDHEVRVRGTIDADTLNTSLYGDVLPKMATTEFLGGNVTQSINASQIGEAQKLVSDKCNAEGVCGKAFRCVGGDTGSPYCVSTCPADRCEHGDCKVDSDQEFYCSCHHDDKFAYTGPRCDIVSEKLGLNEATIIGISVGVGGGVIVILAIVLGCMCYRRSRDKKKDKLKSQFDDYSSAPLHKFRDDKVRLSEMRREEVRPYAVSSQITGRSNYGFDPLDDGRHQKTSDNQPSDPRYRNEMDYKPHRSSGFDRKDDMRDQRHGNFRSGYHSDEDNGDWGDFKPSMNRDGGVDNRLTGQGRPFYDPTDELGFDRTDGRRRSSGLSKGQPMLSQPPLLTGSVRDGESVLKHVDTEQTYAIKRPVFR